MATRQQRVLDIDTSPHVAAGHSVDRIMPIAAAKKPHFRPQVAPIQAAVMNGAIKAPRLMPM